ncbi:hypothetical protein V500_00470 [Pseudogymnoascus sp. VKM F-4518 (FW-2643)]|nr:hypothetical protein V500_00470 [Pseudogymnoascus sp. VKM F-4518 (FW-2643)]
MSDTTVQSKGIFEATVTLTFLTANIFPLIRIIRLHENNPTVRIGRSSKNPLKNLVAAADNCWVDNDVVSRNYARLMFDSDEEAIFIEDTKSTHGTYINNNQIPKYGPTPLANNDIISLGAEIKRGTEMYPECRFRVNYELVPFLAPKGPTNEKEVGCEAVEISDDELCDVSAFEVSDGDDEIQIKDSFSTTTPKSKADRMPGAVDAIEGNEHSHHISLVDSQPGSDNSDEGNEAGEDIGSFSNDDVLTACEVFKPEFDAPVSPAPAVSPSNPPLPDPTTEGLPQLLNPKPISQLPQIKHAIASTTQDPLVPIFRFSDSVEFAAHQTGTGPLKLTVVVGELSGASYSSEYLEPEPNAYNPQNEPDSNNSGTVPKDIVSMQEKWPREPALKRKRDEITDEALQLWIIQTLFGVESCSLSRRIPAPQHHRQSQATLTHSSAKIIAPDIPRKRKAPAGSAPAPAPAPPSKKKSQCAKPTAVAANAQENPHDMCTDRADLLHNDFSTHSDAAAFFANNEWLGSGASSGRTGVKLASTGMSVFKIGISRPNQSAVIALNCPLYQRSQSPERTILRPSDQPIQPIAMALHSSKEDAPPEGSQEHHLHQGGAVSAKTIYEMIRQINRDTSYDDPLSVLFLSKLATEKMRLSILTPEDSTPQVGTLLHPEVFEAIFTDSYLNFSPSVMPTGLPLAMTDYVNPPHPALCYGLLFHAAHASFSQTSGGLFWDHIDGITKYNPDLAIGKYSLAPKLHRLDQCNSLGELVIDKQRDNNGELMWKTFGGFGAKGLQGLIVGSRASGDLAGKEGVVLKAELLAMLIQLAFMGRRDELALSKCDLPQIIVINFTDKFARVVQGTLVRPDSSSDVVEFRISVTEILEYVDKESKIVPGVWKQLLGWTFCRAAKTKRGDDTTGCGTTNSVPIENNNNLIVSKTREKGTNDEDEEALRKASKSTVASSVKDNRTDDEEDESMSKASKSTPASSVKENGTDDDEESMRKASKSTAASSVKENGTDDDEESMRKASKSTVASVARRNKYMSVVEEQNDSCRSSPTPSSPSSSPSP